MKCLDLLDLKQRGLILDIGCGSGISGNVLSEHNLQWIGVDISENMLKICKEKDEALDIVRVDIGEGLPFKPGTFDGVVSVSVLQWLFQTYTSSQNSKKRIRTFFTSLFSVCKPNTRCVLQFFLKGKKDVEFLKNEAQRAGFYGGIHTENPNTRHSKDYLVLDNNFSNVKKSDNKQKVNKMRRKKKIINT